MTEFDIFVRRFLLTYPRIVSSRADVVRRVFQGNGNGLDWNQGRLDFLNPENEAVFTKDHSRDDFLQGGRESQKLLDGLKALTLVDDAEIAAHAQRNYDMIAGKSGTLAEWEDRYDRIDEIAQFVDLEADIDPERVDSSAECPALLEQADSWFATVVPDDVEGSFLDGAIEALDMVHRSLPEMRDEPADMVALVETERTRLHHMREHRAAALGVRPTT